MGEATAAVDDSPAITSQAALEREIHHAGRERFLARVLDSEQAGRADTNPYARPLYRRWLLPLIEQVQDAVASAGRPGRRRAHVGLIKALDPASVAFVGMNTALCTMMAGDSEVDARKLSRAVGAAVFRELVVAVFAHAEADEYGRIQHAITQRGSRDARYKYNSIRHAADEAGVALPEWSSSEREQVGGWLVEVLRSLGFLTVVRRRSIKLGGSIREHFIATLTDEVLTVVATMTEVAALHMPVHVPFIEPPRDWVSFANGGYHTAAMRRLVPSCIATPRVHKQEMLDIYRQADLSRVRAAINHLQAVRWQINGDMLDTLRKLATRLEVGELIPHAETKAPPKPSWLTGDTAPATMTGPQREEFMAWKRVMRVWHTEQRIRRTKFQRFWYATRVAERYRAYDAIYFLYQADFRGRLYAVTTGVNPQGSDMQKALLRFADGKPLATQDARDWFMINGANRYGVDKASFAERIQWVRDNHGHILAMAADPLAHDGWTEADKPLQFLAWCKEYAAWQRDPEGFLSHLPVGMDGSCNGLQHFSAMLRDAVGGAATNLVPADKPRDIYQQVADVVQEKLAALDIAQLSELEQTLARKWQAHGVGRSLVKRSVMTLPYGATRFSCAQFIVDDYLYKGEAPEFEPAEYMRAANFLSHHVWAAIGEVVVAAPEAMAWLRTCAGKLMAAGQETIRWVSPSGFPVVQAYFEADMMRVNSALLGGVQIKVANASERPHKPRHKNGISPNFVHSMDAAHLTLTVLDAAKQGITSLAMIHDDYGTHAADAAALARIIRDTFVRMYETRNPLKWFREHYEGLPDVPALGTLDIRQVRQSPYFFA